MWPSSLIRREAGQYAPVNDTGGKSRWFWHTKCGCGCSPWVGAHRGCWAFQSGSRAPCSACCSAHACPRCACSSHVDACIPLGYKPLQHEHMHSTDSHLYTHTSYISCMQDDRTTGRQDDWTTGLQDDRTTGRQDDRTTRRHDDRTTGRQDDTTTRRHDDCVISVMTVSYSCHPPTSGGEWRRVVCSRLVPIRFGAGPGAGGAGGSGGGDAGAILHALTVRLVVFLWPVEDRRHVRVLPRWSLDPRAWRINILHRGKQRLLHVLLATEDRGPSSCHPRPAPPLPSLPLPAPRRPSPPRPSLPYSRPAPRWSASAGCAGWATCPVVRDPLRSPSQTRSACAAPAGPSGWSWCGACAGRGAPPSPTASLCTPQAPSTTNDTPSFIVTNYFIHFCFFKPMYGRSELET